MVIDNIDVKYCAPVLVQPIHHLSLISLPLDWKTHMISPVYESGKISAQMVDNSRHWPPCCSFHSIIQFQYRQWDTYWYNSYSKRLSLRLFKLAVAAYTNNQQELEHCVWWSFNNDYRFTYHELYMHRINLYIIHWLSQITFHAYCCSARRLYPDYKSSSWDVHE